MADLFDTPSEEWRTCVGSPDYEVSDLGRVRRVTLGRGNRGLRVLRPVASTSGRLQVDVSTATGRKSTFVHVLVAAAFHGPRPLGRQVAHCNGNHLDNRAVNLRYATAVENAADRYVHGTNGRKLDADAIRSIRGGCRARGSRAKLAGVYGVHVETITRIWNGRTWCGLP